MTDTVNVPREAVVAALKEADRPFRQTLSDYRYQILAEAALAAAPKADPCDTHRVHGIRLDPCCPCCPDPEASKAEQKPFGYAYAVPNDTYVLLPNPSLGGRGGKPLYTHPAPANDELLEAAQNAVEEWGMRAGDDDALLPSAEQSESIAALMRAIAKHKGPQS